MYKTALRFSVLRRILDDGVSLTPSRVSGVETIRSYSGRKENLNPSEENETTIPAFRDVLHQKREEAHRSFVIQVKSGESYKDFYDCCSKYGVIKSLYSYDVKNNSFLLVEMKDRYNLLNLLSNSSHEVDADLLPMYSQFLLFKASKSSTSLSPKADCNIDCISRKKMTVQELLENLILGDSVSDQIVAMYENSKIDELGTRLRFLTAAQVELALSGLFPKVRVAPFGSSVNGFGKDTSDLDLVVHFNENNKENGRIIFQNQTGMGTYDQVKEHMEVFAKLMQYFMPGCKKITRILHARVPLIQYTQIFTDARQVNIGDVTKKIVPARKPQYVPHKYLSMGELTQNTLQHLRWMLQKDVLGQDIFLIGRPGPTRRQLAMAFLEMTGREVEYISLSRDTTETDLKQRREIMRGTARYFDQSAVRAATEGRVLVLEGIEKAERNVLPVLNNLLENREMHLEDGRFLIPASRYDKLLKEHSKEELDRWNLVRVSDDFRVIALGLPVPKYVGNPLDPPLRSRFQARDVSHQSFHEQLSILKKIAPNADPGKLTQLLSCSHALLSEESLTLGLPDFPVDHIPTLGELLHHFPGLPTEELLNRLYPYKSFLTREGREAVDHVLTTFEVDRKSQSKSKVEEIKMSSVENQAECVVVGGKSASRVKVPSGSLKKTSPTSSYIPTNYQEKLIAELLQSHSVSDFCLIGPKGCGKSATLLQLANLLNYEVEPVVLYQDMTSRDLIQQRNTLPTGDTVWQNSPLINAALEGRMAVLDGIDRVHPSTLSVIHRLVQDRDVQLYDGKRLVRHDRYDEIKKKHDLSDEDMAASGILRVHPSFRIVGLAQSSTQTSTSPKWLSAEMLSLFLFHEQRPLSNKEERHIIQTLHGSISTNMSRIMDLASFLRTSEDPMLSSLSSSFSTRQLLRIAKRMANYPLDSTYESVQKACLARFLPPLAKQALDKVLQDRGITSDAPHENSQIACRVDDNVVQIGATKVPRYVTSAKTKVPDILFYDVPQHVALLEWLLQDFNLGEHLLLVGNQGVGKNKIADRLLQLMNRPREYIQLHRDTTVQTLTLQPTVKEGVVFYEDSPLVQAVKSGHVLVVDEADKAPTHVTCILKTLVESGEMTLSDGRKIVPYGDARADNNKIIPVHPDFRMIVLANRPGFPFLGNDFFAALGDLFSCHAVDNPSPESEISLLKQYGPSVPEPVILRLVKAFGELRTMADKGLVQYPYSTREVVNIVKHLQEFPEEGLSNVVRNVFDFDRYSSNVLDTLVPVLQKHGIPINTTVKNISMSKDFSLPPIKKYGQWSITRLDNKIPVEVRNIKTSSVRELQSKDGNIDVVEARASVFSELQSHWTVPLSNNCVVTGMAVTLGEDVIHLLTANPVLLCSVSRATGKCTYFNLEAHVSRITYGPRHRYTLTSLDGPLNNHVLLHEENLNQLWLIDTLEGTISSLDLTSASEKVMKTITRASPVAFRLNGQLSSQNQIILHEFRGGKIEVLDLNTMFSYSMELPVKIQSVQIVSEGKWLLQDIENKKYVLEKVSSNDAVPSLLQNVTETVNAELNLGLLVGSTRASLDKNVLSNVIGEPISSPSRLLLSDECFATVAVGFPDLDLSSNDLYSWFRPSGRGLKGQSVFLQDAAQIVTPVAVSVAPREVSDGLSDLLGFLEVLDLRSRSVRYIPVHEIPEKKSWYLDHRELGLFLQETSNEGLVTVDRTGCVRLWETGIIRLQKSLDEWKKMVGAERESLQLTIERDSGKDVSSPKHGKVDPKNEPHVGGNTWAGGTGGRDTAGLGGKGGPYRLDAGHAVHQLSDAEKDDVPEHVKRAAREMGRRAFLKRLKEIQMSEYDHEMYQQYSLPVAKQVQALRVIIGNVQAKAKERQWTRHQTSGDLDDLKLIEGLTGEKTIYRRRAEKEPEPGTPQTKPKRLKIVADVSGSMYRFNGYDGRLDRMMEATVLVMEAFQGHEAKFKYDITGHSGESFDLVFVKASKPPSNNKERLDIIKTMHAHAQFCLSGDHTLPATVHAIESLSKEDCDEAIVVVLSDANLERYGIRPQRFGQALTAHPDVNAYAIFIGSLGDQAERLTAALPAGRSFVCMDLAEIPQILQQIFTSSMLSTA